MHKLYLLVITLFNISVAFTQTINLRTGLWSDTTIWNTNRLPSEYDSVWLQYDIEVDINASCKYLNNGGHTVTVNQGINLNIGTNDLPATTLLRQFLILDTTQAVPHDTLYKYHYSYDNLGRCTGIIVNDRINNKTGYTYNYFNGDDTLIAWRKLINQVYVDSVFEYFTYAAGGIMLSDSVVQYRNQGSRVINTHKYEVVDSFMYSDVRFGSQPLLKGKYIISKDTVGNVVSERDTCFSYNGSFYSYRNNTNITNNYDNTACPFFKLYPQRLTGLNYELITTDDVPFYWFLQRNNTTSHVFNTLPVTSGLGNHNERYNYVYNAANYPIVVIYNDLLHGEVYKGVYYY